MPQARRLTPLIVSTETDSKMGTGTGRTRRHQYSHRSKQSALLTRHRFHDIISIILGTRMANTKQVQHTRQWGKVMLIRQASGRKVVLTWYFYKAWMLVRFQTRFFISSSFLIHHSLYILFISLHSIPTLVDCVISFLIHFCDCS